MPNSVFLSFPFNGASIGPAADNTAAPPFTFLGDLTSGYASSAAGVMDIMTSGHKGLEIAYGTVNGNSTLGSNTINGGTATVFGSAASTFFGMGHFDFGAALVFRNTSGELESWGWNGSAYQPVLTQIVTATKSQIEIRKPDDTRGIIAFFPSSGNPRFSASVPAGTDQAGVDVEYTGGDSTGSGAAGNIVFMTVTPGSSGASTNSQVERMRIRNGDIIIQDSIPLRVGSTNVAGAGSIRMRNGLTNGAIAWRNSTNDDNALFGLDTNNLFAFAYNSSHGFTIDTATDGTAFYKSRAGADTAIVRSHLFYVSDGGSTTISTGVGSVKMSTGNAATNTAWIPFNYAGTVYYVPAWTTNAP